MRFKYLKRMAKRIKAFNSLYEILRSKIIAKKVCGRLSILYMRFAGEALKVTENPVLAFNSLYEILNFDACAEGGG